MKTRALYGFSPDLELFAGKRPTDQIGLLRSWGNTAIFGGYQDPDFVEAAHAAGMKVFAEFGCFIHKKWWDEVPESRPITHEGKPLEPEDWYYGVNPTTPAVRRKQLEVLERLLAQHALDGVWLDFIRWPCHWESPKPYLPHTSFDAYTLSRFSQDTGIDVPNADPQTSARQLLGEYGAEWTAWRCRQITSWVAEAKAILKHARPSAVLGLFGVPWRLSDHEGAIMNVVGQDYRALAEYVDIFSPMVYHMMCGQPVEWIGEVAEEIHALSERRVWPIIQSVDEPTPLSPEEYGEALDVALNSHHTDGVLVFTLKGALDEAKLAVTRARFEEPV